MFIVRMAWREMRWSWRRLLFFFLCLSVGVASIVTLRSVVQSVRAALRSEARTLLGGDLALSTSGAWTPEARRAIEALVPAGAGVTRLETVETLTMVRPSDPAKAVSRLVELLGVGPGVSPLRLARAGRRPAVFARAAGRTGRDRAARTAHAARRRRRRRGHHRRRAVHHSRRRAGRAGTARGCIQPRDAGVRGRRGASRRRGCWVSAAGRRTACR